MTYFSFICIIKLLAVIIDKERSPLFVSSTSIQYSNGDKFPPDLNDTAGHVRKIRDIDGTCIGTWVNVSKSEGFIHSPNFPDPYGDNTVCTWTIEVDYDSGINISFTSFSLEPDTKCSYDVLQIYDGTSDSGELLQTSCGDELPQNILSISHQVFIIFKTDGSNVQGGFRLQYKMTKMTCTGTWTNTSASGGSIHSPNFPADYANNERCIWILEVDSGYGMNISFSDFNLESHDECSYDSLEIYDGYSDLRELIGKWCGTGPSNSLLTIRNKSLIRFKTDRSGVRRGFRLHYEKNDMVCPGTWTNTSRSEGFIQSPNFPNNYEDNTLCKWIIQVDSGYQIDIFFTAFSLESQSDCMYDRVEIFDGLIDSGALLGKLCGTEFAKYIQTSTNQASIIFKSDSSNVRSGFRMHYMKAESTCENTWTNVSISEGFIHSPNYPDFYGNNESCSWVLEVDSGYKINILFENFTLESSNNCSRDSLEIYDGISDSGKFIGKFCGEELPQNIQSFGNQVFIRFETDGSGVRGGFLLHYEMICERVYNATVGVLTSPYYSGDPPSYLNCIYKIEVPTGYHVNLTVSMLAIDFDDNCSHNYLEIQDGFGDNSHEVAKMCSPATKYIMSIYTLIWLKFETRNRTQTKFIARYEAAKFDESICNGTRINTSKSEGSIRSPNFPDSYNGDAFCTWTIEVDSGSRINISFTAINLEYCLFDSLKIYDGLFDSEKLLGKFCGSVLPQSIQTSTNRVFIVFTKIFYPGTFLLHYKATGSTCEGTWTNSSVAGLIRSPNFPDSYSNNESCSWVLEVDSGYKINILFENFTLESDTNCSRDSLEVYDGPSDSGSILGKFCGEELPGNIQSSGNQVFIRFKTDGSGVRSGFLLYYEMDSTFPYTALVAASVVILLLIFFFTICFIRLKMRLPYQRHHESIHKDENEHKVAPQVKETLM